MIIDFFLLGGSKNFVQNESEGRELKVETLWEITKSSWCYSQYRSTVNTALQSIQVYSQYSLTVNTALQSIQPYSQHTVTVNTLCLYGV